MSKPSKSKKTLSRGDLEDSKRNFTEGLQAYKKGPEALQKWADKMFPGAKVNPEMFKPAPSPKLEPVEEIYPVDELVM